MQTFIKTYRVTHIKITLYKKKTSGPSTNVYVYVLNFLMTVFCKN